MTPHRRTTRTPAWAIAIAAGAALALPAGAQIRDGRGIEREIRRPGVQPPEQPAPEPHQEALPVQGTEMISFSSFTEPIELTTLIDFVAEELGVNIAIVDQPSGSIVFNAPMSFERERLLPLLDAMLEQYGYAITYDELTQIYSVRTADKVRLGFGGALATTKIIHTPNVTPSLLQPAIAAAMGGAAPTSIAYVDELGVIVLTATARDVARVEEVVKQILDYRTQIRLHRIELVHIAAPAARDRAIGLVGSGSGTSNNRNLGRQVIQRDPNNPTQVQVPGLSGGTLDNLADRLTIDAQGNALLFRGTADELARVREIVQVIDVPNQLAPKGYFAGSSARQIADIASQRGLGEVITLDNTDPTQSLLRNAQSQFQQAQTSGVGGPVMVVDVGRGSIVYYGTEAQQTQLSDLLEEIGAEDERVVVRTYRLRHAQAETVADLLDALISGQGLGSDGGLLPDNSGVRNAQIVTGVQPVITPEGELQLFGPGGDEVSGAFDPDQVFVVPDELNNQVVVRAPLGQQEELAKLIDRLDLRRPQVYIEAMIVSVTDTRDFRLAVETQILNGQFGFQTNFGLSSASGDPGDFQSQRNVLATLTGGTMAMIQSESIPFIINAIRTNTDAKIISQPSLLVNNNEEATLASVDEQPTTSTSQGDNSTITSFEGFEEAGTTLTVTPTISEGGFLRLQYEVELSSFTGTGSGGVPSPRQTNNVSSAVTVPSDATIVVGGITVSNLRNTVRRIPLLGDIPGLGHLFRDTSQIKTNSVIYVFITPRIMTDPNFYDLKLLTEGPQARVEVDQGVPDLEPAVIKGARTPAWTPPPREPTPTPATDAPRPGAFVAPEPEPVATAPGDDTGDAPSLRIEPLDANGG